MAGGQFVAYFQPVIDLSNGRISSLEALARWRHPAHGLLPPASFLPAMREHGLLRPLSELMLAQALHACRHWRDGGLPVRVSVNMPLQSLTRPNLNAWIVAQLRQAGLENGQLILEFSEFMLSQDWDLADRQLVWLRRASIGVAIDEFGIGLGVVSPLNRQRFSMIKIDPSIVFHASLDPHRRRWLSAALMQGKRAGMETVAIGIEETADLELVRALGCQAAQGFLFAPPMAEAEVELWINSRKTW